MKIIFKSILECLKILFWITLAAIILELIKIFVPIVLFIAFPIAVIILYDLITAGLVEKVEEDK